MRRGNRVAGSLPIESDDALGLSGFMAAATDFELSIASASSPDAGPRLMARRRGLVRLALFGACRLVRGVASSTARSVTRVTAGALDMG